MITFVPTLTTMRRAAATLRRGVSARAALRDFVSAFTGLICSTRLELLAANSHFASRGRQPQEQAERTFPRARRFSLLAHLLRKTDAQHGADRQRTAKEEDDGCERVCRNPTDSE